MNEFFKKELLWLTQEIRKIIEKKIPSVIKNPSIKFELQKSAATAVSPIQVPNPIKEKKEPQKENPPLTKQPRFALLPLEPNPCRSFLDLSQKIKKLDRHFKECDPFPPFVLCCPDESHRPFLEKIAQAINQQIECATTYSTANFDQKQWQELVNSASIELLITVFNPALDKFISQKTFHQKIATKSAQNLFLLYPLERYLEDQQLKMHLWKSLKAVKNSK